MIYCDTSLLVSALTFEPASARAADLLAERRSLAISDWSRTEVASALAQKQRQGRLSTNTRHGIEETWRELLARCVLLPVDVRDFTRAAELVDAAPRGLRAGDALHLAIAINRQCDLATFDQDLADAARALGIAVYS